MRFILLRLSEESGLLFTFISVFRIELPSDTWLYIRPLLCPVKQYHMVSVRWLHSGASLQTNYPNHGRSMFPREPHHPHSDYPALSLTHHQTQPLTTQPLWSLPKLHTLPNTCFMYASLVWMYLGNNPACILFVLWSTKLWHRAVCSYRTTRLYASADQTLALKGWENLKF